MICTLDPSKMLTLVWLHEEVGLLRTYEASDGKNKCRVQAKTRQEAKRLLKQINQTFRFLR